MIVAGLICGTSLDGIDVALVEVAGAAFALRRFATVPLDDALRDAIEAAQPPARVDARTVSELHARVGEAFGDALRAIAGDVAVDLVGSHGITLAHDGDARHTLQVGDAFRIRERAACTVVSDFRSADTAAGGHGAPLVPAVDRLLFGSDDEDRVALNLGGIANITVLPRGRHDEIVAFDSGPANGPIDAEVRRRTGARFDRDGALARRGRVDEALLARLLDDDYLRAAPPKSTGRERYGVPFAERWRAAFDALATEDAIATLTAFSARSVAAAIRRAAPAGATVIAGGGGARNPVLLGMLADALPGSTVAPSDAYGIDADAKEAFAFAVLAVAALRGEAAGLPSVTGARGPRVLGAIAPERLDEVLARLRAEERG